jgi:hypothetical protein
MGSLKWKRGDISLGVPPRLRMQHGLRGQDLGDYESAGPDLFMASFSIALGLKSLLYERLW